MKDFGIGLFYAVVCGMLMKGIFITQLLSAVIIFTAVRYILKQSPKASFFGGIVLGIAIVLLLPF